MRRLRATCGSHFALCLWPYGRLVRAVSASCAAGQKAGTWRSSPSRSRAKFRVATATLRFSRVAGQRGLSAFAAAGPAISRKAGPGFFAENSTTKG